jgi:hypothetical protein
MKDTVMIGGETAGSIAGRQAGMRNVTSAESHSGTIRRGLETRMDKKIFFREMSFAGCN